MEPGGEAPKAAVEGQPAAAAEEPKPQDQSTPQDRSESQHPALPLPEQEPEAARQESITQDPALPLPAPEAQVPEGCRVVLLSPLDVHFSQTRIRAEFQDGRTILESLAEIQSIPLSAGASNVEEADMDGITSVFGDGGVCASLPSTPSASDAEDNDGNVKTQGGEARESLLLCLPFPRIEVTRWRCKLREANGNPRIDPDTGLELYSEEERWFTFDNRRLCCLQRAAIASWPAKVFCEVVEVPQHLAKQRELRKFDTKTFGGSVTIGRRDDPNPESWCWREVAGLPPEEQPDSGVARQRTSLRWRGGRAGGGHRGDPSGYRGRRYYGRQMDKEEADAGGADVIRSVLLFFLIYLGLRIIVMALKNKTKGDGGAQNALMGSESLAAKLLSAIVGRYRGVQSSGNVSAVPTT